MKIISTENQPAVLSLLVIVLSLGIISMNMSSPGRPAVHATSSQAPTATSFTLQKVFGQPNFESTAVNRIVANRAFHIGGVHVDRQNRVYVIDSGNNRILGFRNYTGDNQSADIVIGQPTFEDSGTANGNNTVYGQPTASTLALMPYPAVISTLESPRSGQMASDAEGNLYVVDLDNNRILKFNDPFNTDAVADDVWGQPDFTSRIGYCGSSRQPTSSTLCTESSNAFTSSHGSVFSSGVDIDANNNLWVADTGNNRVLKFSSGSKVADVVLGQTDFGSNNFRDRYESSLNELVKPVAVRVKSATGEVYVLEGEWAGESRIVVFGPNPASGATAIREIGKAVFQDSQPTEATNWENHAGKWVHTTTGLYWARGFVFDPTGAGDVWVNDGGNERVVLFDTAGNMVDVIGQPNLDSTGCLGLAGQGYAQKDGSRNSLCNNDGEIGVDSNNNLYISKLYFPRDVARFALPLERDATQNNIVKSNGWLLHGEQGAGWNQFSGRTMENPFGMAKFGSQLFVSDGQRILVWNDHETKPMFADADFVIGQDNFIENKNNNGGVFSALNVNNLTVGGGHLWASTGDRVFAFALPITQSGKNLPVAKILYPGKFGAIGNVVWADDGARASFHARGLAYQASSDTLWIGDSDNFRVLRVTNPLGDATVDLVLGQPDKNSITRNGSLGTGPNARGIAEAWSLNFDQLGNLYVVDSVYEGGANRRVLRFDVANLVPQSGNIFVYPNASGVYAKDGFTSTNYWGSGTPQTPIAVAFDSQNRMILTVDGYGNPQYERVFIYPSTHTLESAPQPSYKIALPMGQGAVSVLGTSDNQLIIQDHTWNRINFVDISYPAIPTATLVPTATLIPTASPTPVVSVNNLLVNPGFESDDNNDTYPDNWTSKPQFTRSGANVFAGQYAGRHYSATNVNYNVDSTDMVGIVGSKKYRFAHRVSILPTTDTFKVAFQIKWKNASGTTLRTNTANAYKFATTGWVYAEYEAVAPKNAVKAQIIMNMDSLKTTVYVDDLVFVRVN